MRMRTLALILLLSVPLLTACDPSGSSSCGDGQGACPELPSDTLVSDADGIDEGAEADVGETRILTVAFKEDDVPEDGSVVIAAETAGATASVVGTVRLGSAGSAPLTVQDVAIASVPPGALRFEARDGGILPGIGHTATINPGDGLSLDLVFTPSGVPVTATVDITSDGGAFRFQVTVSEPEPRLGVDPKVLDFGLVPTGTTVTKSLSLTNSGTATLEITKFMLTGYPTYTVVLGGHEYPISAESASTGVIIDAPIRIEQGKSEMADVRFQATGPETAEGKLILFGNDPSAAAGVSIDLIANR